MRLEDTKRFTIFGDDFAANPPNPSTDSVGRNDEELTVRKLLDQDFAVAAVSEALNPMRKRHHVAVADPPDFHDCISAALRCRSDPADTARLETHRDDL